MPAGPDPGQRQRRQENQDRRGENADVRDAGETQHGERQRRAGKYVQIQLLVRHKPRSRTQRTATVNSHAG